MLVVVRHVKLVCDGSFLSRCGMMTFVMSSLLFVSDCIVGCTSGDVVDVVWCMNGVVMCVYYTTFGMQYHHNRKRTS